MKKHSSILDRVIHGSELSSQPLPGVPLIEVMGFSRVLIENHLCVCSYSLQKIEIRVKSGFVTVGGEGLHLVHMSPDQIVITGSIQQIQLYGESNG